MWGKFISTAMAFFMLVTIVTVPVWAKDEPVDYAEVVFGAESKYVNMHEDYPNYMVPTVEQGRMGLKSANAYGGESIWLGINDDFMYDLPPDTPVDVIVEYFDGGKGRFSIHYDSYNPDSEWSGIAGINDVYKETELVYLQDTKEWKSYTFHIEDLRAANRIYNGDIRLSTWSPKYGMSPEDVLFGSIKIVYGEYKNPLKSKIHLGVVGNLLSPDEEAELYIDSKNKDKANPISCKVFGEIYDNYDRLIGKIEDVSYDLEPLQEEIIKIPFIKPKKHGLYKIKGNIAIDYKSKGEVINQPFNIKFSVSHVFEAGEGSDEFGSCHQIMAYGMGDPSDVAEVYNRAGLSYIRDNLNANIANFDGEKWVVKQECIEGWKILREHGINVIGILFGPNPTKGLPVTESDFQEWEKWVRDCATQLAGVIDIYEIWNEANISAFNKNGATPEDYAKLAKRTYPILKNIDPDCIVLGLGTAAMDGLNIDYKWTRRVFEAGGGEAMDAFSIHPYDWSGSFRDKNWIESANLLHELMKEFGLQDKEVWITEFGFSTYVGDDLGYTRQEQYQNHALARAIAKAYGLYDKYIFYCFADRVRRDNIEENWGIVDYYFAEESPYAAKESFIAMTAYSYFINQDTDIKKVIEEDSVYSMHFYNNKLGKDILYLQSHNFLVNEAGEVKKNYKLGCPSVDVYDAFGNKINTLYADNGEYSFILSAEPMYIVGNFTDFQIVEYNALVDPGTTVLNGARDDIISLKFIKNTEKTLTVEIEDSIEVIENNGFVGDTAEIKIKVPNLMDAKILFGVSVVDNDGKAYYASVHTLNITHPIEINVVSEPASELNNNQWRIRATVKNICYGMDIKGIYKIESPDAIAAMNTERYFELSPQEEITYLFVMPEKVNKSVIELISVAMLENGHIEENVAKLNLTTAVYAENKPTIDGVIDNGEWMGSWIGADEEKDVREIANWGGPSDISFVGNLMWDEENFYFLGIVRDDVHYIYHGNDPWNMWSTDSIQFSLDDRKYINPVEESKFAEFGMGALPSGGVALYRYSSYYDGHDIGIVENCDLAIKRYDTYTVYECRIPWDEIFYKDYVVDVDGKEKTYRVSILANDNDGDGRGWIEYMSGIGQHKSVSLFGEMRLKK